MPQFVLGGLFTKDASTEIRKIAQPSFEVIPGSFAQEVSEDRYNYWNTNDSSWLCTSNDVDRIAAKVHDQPPPVTTNPAEPPPITMRS